MARVWLRPARRQVLRSLAALAGAALLAACQTPFGAGHPPALQPAAPPAQPASSGEVIGTGATRVALILPRTAPGNGAGTALAFRNAAALAIQDFPNAGLQLAIYDDAGTPAGAQAAIATALAGGARIVLGPLFSTSVSAVAPTARQAGVPVIAFSSDAAVAAPGVYLLSFLPAEDIRRIVAYSAGNGRKSFAALIPANAYGAVVEAAFREAVGRAGGRIVAVERYTADAADQQARARSIAALGPQIDALLLPDAGDAAPQLGAALSAAGVARGRVQYLGSGQWDDARILGSPDLVGGWFPAPPRQGFETFAAKYQAAFGAVPPRNATLAYDATVLAAGLVRRFGEQAFTADVLTDPNGFNGIDGIFRFVPGGQTERRLSVYEVTGSGRREIAPAASSFSGGS